MIGIHGRRLTGEIACFISILIVHVVRNSYLGKDAGMVPHVIHSLSPDRGELVSEAVADSCLTHFDCESW